MRLGFMGLGIMGQPMALNLARAGIPLLVWNRTPSRAEPVLHVGAHSAGSAAELVRRCDIVLMMLSGATAIDAVLERKAEAFSRLVADTLFVNMGTNAPEYSQALEASILAAGGKYVEAPVSGSQRPAERGELLGMLAGESDAIERVRPLLAPMCKAVYDCGAVPSALHMKLAVNLFLITQVAGLAEAAHFAQQQGLDLDLFRKLVDQGPMASEVSRSKLAKLVDRDFSPQASIADLVMNTRLITDAAHQSNTASPLIDACRELYSETAALSRTPKDMCAVIEAIEARSLRAGHAAKHTPR